MHSTVSITRSYKMEQQFVAHPFLEVKIRVLFLTESFGYIMRTNCRYIPIIISLKIHYNYNGFVTSIILLKKLIFFSQKKKISAVHCRSLMWRLWCLVWWLTDTTVAQLIALQWHPGKIYRRKKIYKHERRSRNIYT